MNVINVTPEMRVLALGRLGENEVTQFVFDVSDWLEEFPGATIGLAHHLPHSSESYPCAIVSEGDGKYSWTITSAELAVEGEGECELLCVKDSAVKMGKIYTTKIGKSLDPDADPPEEWEGYIAQVTGLKEDTEDAAEDAEAYAVGKRGGTDVESTDPAYHNNAKYYSEQAAGSAGSAAGSATTAGNKASDAEAYAVGKRGGVDVESGDAAYHNNSKYYSEQAAGSATAAAASAAQAGSKANRAAIAKEYADLTYPVAKGTWCWKENVLYEANQTISTSEAWTAAHWTQTTIEEEHCALKSAINGLQEEVGESGSQTTYELPTGYQSANYSNSAGNRQFKYVDNKLKIYKSATAGSVSVDEITTSSASLTINDNLAKVITAGSNIILKMSIENSFPADVVTMAFRFYNESYSSHKAVTYVVPVGTNEVEINVNNISTSNNIDIETYKNFIIRALGSAAHTATASEEVTVLIDGFGSSNHVALHTKVETNTSDIASLSTTVTGHTTSINNNTSDITKLKGFNVSSVAGNVFQFSPFYAHLFLNTITDNASDTYVPSQSMYDIEISKRLGFKVIEANTHILTDGESLVTHGTSNKFGAEFVAASGSSYTDAQVQDTTIAEVSMDWVRTNVRYKAKYAKQQVAPLTLKEFLLGCRANNMIPLINYKDIGQVAIADSVMGKDNYIMYGAGQAVRAISNCVIATFSNLTTKQAIYDWVDGIKNPCIVGVTHYENFSLSDWKDIIDNVHKKGGMLAFAYMTPAQEQDLLDIGFDGGASQFSLNPCDSGNLANLSADTGFSDFTVTGGTESNAQLAMNQNGTIAPASALSSCQLSGMWLDVTFKGSISVSMGRFITHSNSGMSATDRRTVHLSTYALNSVPTFEIKATANDTIIENIVFKASKL